MIGEEPTQPNPIYYREEEKEEKSTWELTKIATVLSLVFATGLGIGIMATIIVWGMDKPVTVVQTKWRIIEPVTTTTFQETPFEIDPRVLEQDPTIPPDQEMLPDVWTTTTTTVAPPPPPPPVTPQSSPDPTTTTQPPTTTTPIVPLTTRTSIVSVRTIPQPTSTSSNSSTTLTTQAPIPTTTTAVTEPPTTSTSIP